MASTYSRTTRATWARACGMADLGPETPSLPRLGPDRRAAIPRPRPCPKGGLEAAHGRRRDLDRDVVFLLECLRREAESGDPLAVLAQILIRTPSLGPAGQ